MVIGDLGLRLDNRHNFLRLTHRTCGFEVCCETHDSVTLTEVSVCAEVSIFSCSPDLFVRFSKESYNPDSNGRAPRNSPYWRGRRETDAERSSRLLDKRDELVLLIANLQERGDAGSSFTRRDAERGLEHVELDLQALPPSLRRRPARTHERFEETRKPNSKESVASMRKAKREAAAQSTPRTLREGFISSGTSKYVCVLDPVLFVPINSLCLHGVREVALGKRVVTPLGGGNVWLTPLAISGWQKRIPMWWCTMSHK